MDAYVEHAKAADMIKQSKFKIIVELDVVDEYIDDNLDNYHDITNNTIYSAPNGYSYFAIDGLTVTFFRPITDSFKYHIVLGYLPQEELNKRNILYDDLLNMNPVFTFNL